MTIFDIELVLLVAETLSFSEAAYTANVSQSSLSKHIIRVEEELNCHLFDRSTRKTRLTKEGELFVPRAKAIIENYHLMLNSIQHANRHDIRIGMISQLYNVALSECFLDFFNSYPTVSLSFFQESTSKLFEMLLRGDIDLMIGVVREEIEQQENLQIFPIGQDEMVVTTSCRHPFSSQPYIEAEKLCEENFIGLDLTSGTNHITEDLWNRCGKHARIVHRSSNPEIVCDFVCRDKGVSLLAKRIVINLGNTLPDLRWTPLSPPLYRTIALILNQESLEEPHIKNFVDMLLAHNEKIAFFNK